MDEIPQGIWWWSSKLYDLCHFLTQSNSNGGTHWTWRLLGECCLGLLWLLRPCLAHSWPPGNLFLIFKTSIILPTGWNPLWLMLNIILHLVHTTFQKDYLPTPTHWAHPFHKHSSNSAVTRDPGVYSGDPMPRSWRSDHSSPQSSKLLVLQAPIGSLFPRIMSVCSWGFFGFCFVFS